VFLANHLANTDNQNNQKTKHIPTQSNDTLKGALIKSNTLFFTKYAIQTYRTWFICLSRHPVRKRSRSILTTAEPARGQSVDELPNKRRLHDEQREMKQCTWIRSDITRGRPQRTEHRGIPVYQSCPSQRTNKLPVVHSRILTLAGYRQSLRQYTSAGCPSMHCSVRTKHLTV